MILGILVNLAKSVIFQEDANHSPFLWLNMLPFHVRLERLKLTYYSLISFFSKYYFKAGTRCLLLSSHVFTALEFDVNYFGVPTFKNSKATWP